MTAVGTEVQNDLNLEDMVESTKPKYAPKGTFVFDSDEAALAALREVVGEEPISITDFSRENPRFYAVLLDRNLIDVAVDAGTLIRKIAPNGTYVFDSDEAALAALREVVGEEPIFIDDFKRMNSQFHKILNDRNLVDVAVDAGILVRKRAKRGTFVFDSDEAALNALRHVVGSEPLSLSDFEAKERYFSKVLRNMNLLDVAVDKGILIREIAKRGSFVFDSDEAALAALCDIVGSEPVSISRFRKTNSQFYNMLCNRNLVDVAVDAGILVRKRAKRGTFVFDSDEAALSALRVIVGSKLMSIREFSNQHPSFYNVLKERNIIDSAVDNGLLIRQKNKNGTFRFSSVGDALSRIRKVVGSKPISIGDFSYKEPSLYDALEKNGFIDIAVEAGLLLRKKRKNGTFNFSSQESAIIYLREIVGQSGMDWKYFVKNYDSFQRVLKKNGWLSEAYAQGLLYKGVSDKPKPLHFQRGTIFEYLGLIALNHESSLEHQVRLQAGSRRAYADAARVENGSLEEIIEVKSGLNIGEGRERRQFGVYAAHVKEGKSLTYLVLNESLVPQLEMEAANHGVPVTIKTYDALPWKPVDQNVLDKLADLTPAERNAVEREVYSVMRWSQSNNDQQVVEALAKAIFERDTQVIQSLGDTYGVHWYSPKE